MGHPCDERQKKCTVASTDSFFFVSLDIKNEGTMDGKVVVQCYFGQQLASRVRFSQMLLDFAKSR